MSVSDFKRDGKWVKTIQVDRKGFNTYSFERWSNMRNRCLPGGAEQARNSTYVGCTVEGIFTDFQLFTEWHVNQVGYGMKGYHLDKDLLEAGNKIYSENTCVLVPSALNKLLCLTGSKRGSLPLGVCFDKRTCRQNYVVSITTDNIHRYVGTFRTEAEAVDAYCSAKNAAIYDWYIKTSSGVIEVDDKVVEKLKVMRIQDYM